VEQIIMIAEISLVIEAGLTAEEDVALTIHVVK